MASEQQRHDIGGRAWEKIRPYTIGEKGTRGGNARDTRQFINGVFWILHTGVTWRDVPETYGNWKNVHRRFCRWRGIAVCYAKNVASFVATVQIRCIAMLYCYLAPSLLTTPSKTRRV